MPSTQNVSRREFLLMASAAGGAAVGALAFPQSARVVEAAGPGAQRVTNSYARVKIAKLDDLETWQPIDFEYPLETHRNFLVKLGVSASDGVGPDADIVAFSYACSHMGCPLMELFQPRHNVIGPCPCHYTTFDLSKNGIMAIGQATQSLPQITLDIDGADIVATGVTGLVYGHSNNLTGGAPIS